MQLAYIPHQRYNGQDQGDFTAIVTAADIQTMTTTYDITVGTDCFGAGIAVDTHSHDAYCQPWCAVVVGAVGERRQWQASAQPLQRDSGEDIVLECISVFWRMRPAQPGPRDDPASYTAHPTDGMHGSWARTTMITATDHSQAISSL